MSAHAESVYPEECCGLMLGELSRASAQKQVIELVPVENKWSVTIECSDNKATPKDSTPKDSTPEALTPEALTPEALTKERRYTIDPKDMLRVQKRAREKGLSVIGIYHSHPDHVAEPSECDRAQAWPEYAYTILSVQEGRTVDICNWVLDSHHQFQPEALQINPSSATDRMPLPA